MGKLCLYSENKLRPRPQTVSYRLTLLPRRRWSLALIKGNTEESGQAANYPQLRHYSRIESSRLLFCEKTGTPLTDCYGIDYLYYYFLLEVCNNLSFTYIKDKIWIETSRSKKWLFYLHMHCQTYSFLLVNKLTAELTKFLKWYIFEFLIYSQTNSGFSWMIYYLKNKRIILCDKISNTWLKFKIFKQTTKHTKHS